MQPTFKQKYFQPTQHNQTPIQLNYEKWDYQNKPDYQRLQENNRGGFTYPPRQHQEGCQLNKGSANQNTIKRSSFNLKDKMNSFLKNKKCNNFQKAKDHDQKCVQLEVFRVSAKPTQNQRISISKDVGRQIVGIENQDIMVISADEFLKENGTINREWHRKQRKLQKVAKITVKKEQEISSQFLKERKQGIDHLKQRFDEVESGEIIPEEQQQNQLLNPLHIQHQMAHHINILPELSNFMQLQPQFPEKQILNDGRQNSKEGQQQLMQNINQQSFVPYSFQQILEILQENPLKPLIDNKPTQPKNRQKEQKNSKRQRVSKSKKNNKHKRRNSRNIQSRRYCKSKHDIFSFQFEQKSETNRQSKVKDKQFSLDPIKDYTKQHNKIHQSLNCISSINNFPSTFNQQSEVLKNNSLVNEMSNSIGEAETKKVMRNSEEKTVIFQQVIGLKRNPIDPNSFLYKIKISSGQKKWVSESKICETRRSLFGLLQFLKKRITFTDDVKQQKSSWRVKDFIIIDD